ncbi:hypothetical protein CB1_000781003 [Camelus ferus]|nr:hypothetical protein CB1_000781003 [Camelus ferus]
MRSAKLTCCLAGDPGQAGQQQERLPARSVLHTRWQQDSASASSAKTALAGWSRQPRVVKAQTSRAELVTNLKGTPSRERLEIQPRGGPRPSTMTFVVIFQATDEGIDYSEKIPCNESAKSRAPSTCPSKLKMKVP